MCYLVIILCITVLTNYKLHALQHYQAHADCRDLVGRECSLGPQSSFILLPSAVKRSDQLNGMWEVIMYIRTCTCTCSTKAATHIGLLLMTEYQSICFYFIHPSLTSCRTAVPYWHLLILRVATIRLRRINQ